MFGNLKGMSLDTPFKLLIFKYLLKTTFVFNNFDLV